MRVALMAIAGLALAAAACGGGKSSASSASADPNALLASANSAAQKVTSFHFHLTHENGATPMPLNLQLVDAEGDFALPDKVAADVKAKAGTLNASLKVVSIGDKTWITNPFSRKWQELPGATIKDIADPQALIGAMLTGLKDAKEGGEAQLDGVTTRELSGSVDGGALQAGLPSAQPGHVVNVDLWVGEKDSLPRRARINGKLSDNEPDNIVRQIDFSRFNASVDIRPPE